MAEKTRQFKRGIPAKEPTPNGYSSGASIRVASIPAAWSSLTRSGRSNIAPLRGWGPRGARLKAKAPFGRCRDRIDAPCLFDGPINGEAFLAYAQTFLGPTLKPGDVVIMDNLGGHRGGSEGPDHCS